MSKFKPGDKAVLKVAVTVQNAELTDGTLMVRWGDHPSEFGYVLESRLKPAKKAKAKEPTGNGAVVVDKFGIHFQRDGDEWWLLDGDDLDAAKGGYGDETPWVGKDGWKAIKKPTVLFAGVAEGVN